MGQPRRLRQRPRRLRHRRRRAAQGLLAGSHLLDATSGNTGIAYAMLGAALGFPVTLCMPSNVSPERKQILAAYGANIVWTDPADGSDGAIRKARELAAGAGQVLLRRPVRQRRELEGPLPRHRQRDLGADRRPRHPLRRRPGHQRHLHGHHPPAEGAEPGDPVHLHAARLAVQRPRRPEAHGHGDRAAHLRPELADANIEMPTESAYEMAKHLGRNQGLLVGISAAAAVAAASRLREEEAEGRQKRVIVTILCDSADKYLSERFWEDDGSNQCFEQNQLGRITKRSMPAARAWRRDLPARVLRRPARQGLDGSQRGTGQPSAQATPAPTPPTTATTSRRRSWSRSSARHGHQASISSASTTRTRTIRRSGQQTDFAEAHWLGCSYVITSVEQGNS